MEAGKNARGSRAAERETDIESESEQAPTLFWHRCLAIVLYILFAVFKVPVERAIRVVSGQPTAELARFRGWPVGLACLCLRICWRALP